MAKKMLGNARLENCAYRHIPTVKHEGNMVHVFCKCGLGVKEESDDEARKSWNKEVAKQKKRRKSSFTKKDEPPRSVIDSVYQNPANTKKRLNTYRDCD